MLQKNSAVSVKETALKKLNFYKNYTAKLSPQPQLRLALGLMK